MSAPSPVTYRVLSIDGSVHDIARRYGTDADSIWSWTQNIGEWKRRGLKSTKEFVDAVRPGDAILIYYRGDADEWVLHMHIAEPTLEELCTKKNAEAARRFGTRLTPKFLWNHLLNASLRNTVLSNLTSDDERKKLDVDPTQAKIAGLSALIPYPIRPVVGPTCGAPSKAGQRITSGVVELPPAWIVRFSDHLKRIEDATLRLTAMSSLTEKLRTDGEQVCSTLIVLHVLLEMMSTELNAVVARYPGSQAQANLTALNNFEKTYLKLLDVAMKNLFASAPGTIKPGWEAGRATAGEELRTLLNDQQFRDSAQRVLVEKTIVDGVPIEPRMIGVLRRAYEELVISPLADVVVKELRAALDLLGTASKDAAPAQATNALSVIVSFAGTATSTIGNLPGPSTLAISVLQSVAFYLLPTMMRGSATAQALADRLLTGLTTVAGFPKPEADALKEKVLYGTVLKTGPDGQALVRGPGTRVMIEIAAEDIAAKLHKSVGWNVGVGVLSALALYGAIDASDPITLRKVMNVTGASATWALAAIQTFDALLPTGAIGSVLTKYGNGIGILATVTSVLSGAITFYEGASSPQRNVEKMVLGAIQFLGGGASIAGLMLMSPWVQVLGTGVVVVSTAYVTIRDTDWDAITDTGAKRVFLAQLKWVEKQDVFVEARAVVPDLDSAFNAVMNAVKRDKSALVGLSPTGETRSRLDQLGFAADDINRICPSFPVQWMPRGG